MVDKNEPEGEYDFLNDAPSPEEAARKAPAEPEAPAQILPERTCPHCGYKIMGKPPRGRCPECAAPLDELSTDQLQFSDGAWLSTVSNGTLLIAIAILVQVGAIILGQAGKWTDGAAVHVIATATMALGVALATKTEPGIGTSRAPFARIARWTAFSVAILWLLPLIKLFKNPTPTDGVDGIAVVLLAATALQTCLVSLHLRTLSARVPNDSLVAQFFNLSAILPATCLGLLLLQLLGQANVKGMSEKFLCGFSILGGLIVVVLWTIITVIRLGIELRNCAVAGETIAMRKAMRAQAKK